ncbi:acetamidase/formamidase family protein [Sinobaca sp. H24]|uniref:acetamidase/formamidase family protein n=1 Tax=Sinobaca sp. H24 TaxID=2923376 RepID=UPI0020798B73|nr:acetamidase/formamidase family protein [Sinobaca sp. H24]
MNDLTKKIGTGSMAVLMSLPFAAGVSAEQEASFTKNTITPEEADGDHYIPSTVENIQWGDLPNLDSEAIKTIESGETVTFDTVSHEGIMEDQGRDPVEYFKEYGIEEDEILQEAKDIAESDIDHDFDEHGPHVVTGPVAIEGAEPGDVLKIEVLDLEPRVPYGVISNRHYKGALPGEFPENEGPQEGADEDNPELYNNISTFTPIEKVDGEWIGEIPGEDVTFPLDPFMGMMGVASATEEYVSSVPPSETGGNIDINELGEDSSLYLPIKVDGGMFYTGDPHFSQGDGEVALTALEGSLRGTFRLTVLKKGEDEIPGDSEDFTQPFGETEDFWIPIGLNEDLDEAMKEATRESIDFLDEEFGMDRAKALAYLSAATDFEVSQVVDQTKGIHSLIRKSDFEKKIALNAAEMAAAEDEENTEMEEGGVLPNTASNMPLFALIGALTAFGGAVFLIRRKNRSVS